MRLILGLGISPFISRRRRALPPRHVAAMQPRLFEQATGTQTFNVAPNISGADSFSLVSPPAGVTISAAGVVSVNTGSVIDATITVRGANSAGSVDVKQFICVMKNTNVLYVAKTGNDSTGTGTLANPYLTIKRAVDVDAGTGGGRRVAVRAGVYNERLVMWQHGVSGNPNQVTAYAGEDVIVDMGGLSDTAADMPNYGEVIGLTFRNGPSAGVQMWNRTNCRVAACKIHNFHLGGIFVGGNTPGTANTVGHIFEWNQVFDTVRQNAARDMTLGWARGIGIDSANDTIIRHNWVMRNYGEGIGIRSARRGDVLENWAYDNFSVNVYIDNCAGTSANPIEVKRNASFQTGDTGFYRTISGTPRAAWSFLLGNEGASANPPEQMSIAYVQVQDNQIAGLGEPEYFADSDATFQALGTGTVLTPNTMLPLAERQAAWLAP